MSCSTLSTADQEEEKKPKPKNVQTKPEDKIEEERRTIDKVLYPTTPLQTKMKEQSIIPDVLDEFPPALIELEVIYDAKEENIKVELGNVLTPTKVQNAPTVKWTADPETFYLLCMTDPDAPSRETPIMREWHHWLVGNIPGDEIDKGDTLSEYIGAGPPKGTGKHRYVFLLYQQRRKHYFTEHHLTNKSSKGRAQFSIKKFALKYKLGEPIAGNFFLAEFDDYVPKLYEQLHCC